MRAHPLLAALLVVSTISINADEPTRRAQEELRKRNLYFGDINGQTNPELIEALKRYQERKGFEPTGALSEETARSLKIEGFAAKTASQTPLPDIPVLKSDSARELAEPDRAALQPDIEKDGVSPSKPPESPPAAVTIDSFSAEAVTDFVRQFLRDAESDDVDLQVRYFGFPVEYFDHGRASREFVAKDTRNYLNRWPQRQYSLVGPVKFAPGRNSGELEVEFIISFHVSSGSRTADGKTRNLWKIQKDRENFKILAINEQRLHD